MRYQYPFLFGVMLALLLALPVSARTPQSRLPLQPYNNSYVPDWSRITFNSMGGMQSDGSFVAPPQLTEAIGFDASVSWVQGTPVGQVIRLGFVDQAFGLQNLNLEQISQAIGLPINNLTLAELGLLNFQNLGSLVSAVPDLANLLVEQVPPIAALIGGFANPGQSIGDAIQNPQVAQTPLTPILSQFNIGDIPGLDQAQFSGFQHWQQSFIDDIPGLSDLPFSDFPIPPANAGGVALLNVPLSGEGFISNTVSGSDRQGFAVPCLQDHCNNAELGEPFLGRRWIVGSEQSIQGGHNLLGNVNSGQEHTGRLFTGNPNPEAEPFKLILNSVDDSAGTISMGLAMHWCYHHSFPDPLPNPDCTPYFIEFPDIFTWHEQDTIYIGGDGTTVASTDTSVASNPSPSGDVPPVSNTPSPTGSDTTPVSNTPSPTSSPDLTCASVVQDAVLGPTIVGQTEILASFTPKQGYTLDQAAQLCAFRVFNWQQKILSWPLPSTLFQTGNLTPLSAPPPFFDPPPGGYAYQNPPNNAYPFYWNESGNSQDPYSLQANTVGNTINFADSPANPCLPGGSSETCGGLAPEGSFVSFETALVGVGLDGSATNLGIFEWLSTFNGTSGGVATANNPFPVDPGSGTGGITIIRVRKNLYTPPNSLPTLDTGTNCNGTFSGTFSGDLIVSSGQTCTFVDATITGDILVDGGQFIISDSRINGNLKIVHNSRFNVGPSVTIEKDIQISGLESGSTSLDIPLNQICYTSIYGSLSIDKLSNIGAQIGSDITANCPGNYIYQNFSVMHNEAPIKIYNNRILKTLNCEGNTSVTGAFNNAYKKEAQCSNL